MTLPFFGNCDTLSGKISVKHCTQTTEKKSDVSDQRPNLHKLYTG